MSLSLDDLRQIAAQGVSVEEIEEQLELHREPPPPTRLLRPCLVGDGILRLPDEEHRALIELYDRAASAGRFTKFVPASGAASRMFQQLTRLRAEPAAGSPKGRRFLDQLDRFAFAPEVREAASSEELGALLDALLSPQKLDYARLPKALIPFHRYPDGSRTAAEEHLRESAALVLDGDRRCRAHFTVPLAREQDFRDRVDHLAERLGEALDLRFELGYSTQAPATDTLAATPEGEPFRDKKGRLLFRPGGHGSLIGNLGDLGADLVFIKNIDNILPEHAQPLVLHWKKVLAGLLLRLERRCLEILERCHAADDGPWLARALAFTAEELMVPAAAALATAPAADQRSYLLDRLERPLRVCGVVPNLGDPGGGPFWVESDGEETLQIVETSQIDRRDPDQEHHLFSATHFNPVDLVCRVRSHLGTAYDLQRFVDPRTAFVCRKSYGGRPLSALERPGLWNGAMAHWNTVFVEVPSATFGPVKTVFDLLSPQHQPRD